MIDLHCHSTASDGTFSPANLIIEAKSIGITSIALTDHDTINGIDEAKKNGIIHNIEVITGVELSCEFGINELHIVGLFIDDKNKELNEFFTELSNYRYERNTQLLAHLNNIGIPINRDELLSQNDKFENIGRPNFARTIVSKGFAKNIFEAFSKFLSNDKITNVKRKKISDSEAISIIHKAGGLAILAHPDQIGINHNEFISLIEDLKEKGLDGIEVYYTGYKKKIIKEYKYIARKYSLLLSGGSDFHGEQKQFRAKLGYYQDKKIIPPEILDRMKDYLAHIT